MALHFSSQQVVDIDDILVTQIVIQVVVSAVFGTICAIMAPGRGRSAVGWFFIGFVVNCVGLIILLLIPDLKIEAEKERRHREETRRLREQLKKERQVADARHEAHDARLGVHDRALGLDTSAPLLENAPAPPPLPSAANPPRDTLWHYAFDGQRRGPVPANELREMWLDQRIPDATLVWCEGMRDWRPIGEVGDTLGDSHA